MTEEDDDEKRKRSKRFDRAWKQIGRVSMPPGIPLCEAELPFLYKADELYPSGYVWPGFAPLYPLLEERVLVVEHFSDSLRADARERIRLLNRQLVQRYKALSKSRKFRESRHLLAGSRPPILLVAAPSEPRTFLRDEELEPHPEIPGVYRGLGAYAELLYLWFYGLDPEDRRWDLLRWAIPPKPTSSVDRMRYFKDSSVSVEQKRQVWSVLMSEQYAIEFGPGENPYDVVLERGRKQGLERGLERGLEPGYQSLMQIAQHLMTTEELHPFEQSELSVELIDQLRQAVMKRLDSDS